MTEFISTCSMPLAVIFLIVGFFFLVKGADIFVEGSSSIAKRFHVPAIIIGLTIVAMGTSLPETAVSVVAAIQQWKRKTDQLGIYRSYYGQNTITDEE